MAEHAKRVLVTGAGGFIGRALVRRLIADGNSVVCTGRRQFDFDSDLVTWRLGSIEDPEFVRNLVRESDADVVFHLASLVSGSRAIELVVPTATTNLMTSIHLLEAVTEVGCERVVLLGTGDHPGPDEPPCSPYAAAKWATLGYARMFRSLYDTPVATARPFMVYGPEQPDVSKVVPYVITSFLRGDPPVLTSGYRRCDWVYVDDVVEGLLTIATDPVCIGRMVDLGTGRLDSVRTVVEQIRTMMASDVEPEFGGSPDRPGETEWLADAATTEALCGWTASVDLTNGLARTIEWYRRHPI